MLSQSQQRAILKIIDDFINMKSQAINLFDYLISFISSSKTDYTQRKILRDLLVKSIHNQRTFFFHIASHYYLNTNGEGSPVETLTEEITIDDYYREINEIIVSVKNNSLTEESKRKMEELINKYLSSDNIVESNQRVLFESKENINTNSEIFEKISEVKAWYQKEYPEFMSEHFMILVGDKETFVDDLSCSANDQKIIEKILKGGTPKFLHLVKDYEVPNDYDWDAHDGKAPDLKYQQATPEIQQLIDEINEESSKINAVSDSGFYNFNYSNEELNIFNGKCQDLGRHHLGFFRDTQVVTEMNKVGYGVTTWYNLPIYSNSQLIINFDFNGFEVSSLKFSIDSSDVSLDKYKIKSPNSNLIITKDSGVVEVTFSTSTGYYSESGKIKITLPNSQDNISISDLLITGADNVILGSEDYEIINTTLSELTINIPQVDSVTENESYSDVEETTTHRYLISNNWPTFDNWSSYTSVNPNEPLPRDIFTLKIPITPTYPTDVTKYNYFNLEFANSEERDFYLNSDNSEEDKDYIDYTYKDLEAPPQFWIIGLVGRFNKTHTHWSSNEIPQEILFLDPLPAACGGLNMTDDEGVYDPTKVLTTGDCKQEWDTNWVTPNGTPPVSFDVTSGPTSDSSLYRPGYFYRYFTGDDIPIGALEMDVYGGHTQNDGDWHMHTTKKLFQAGYEETVIGYGLDGTPIMGGGSTVYDDSGNELFDNGTGSSSAKSSWIGRDNDEYSKISEDYARNGQGYYHFDYKFVNGEGNLDEFNGGYTYLKNLISDELELTYAYFVTQEYPNGPRNLRGEVKDVYSDGINFT